MDQKFSKVFVASLMSAARNISSILKREDKLHADLVKISAELEELEKQRNIFDAPIKGITGYSLIELMDRVKEPNGKFKWVLKYPDTIIPTPETSEPSTPSDGGSSVISDYTRCENEDMHGIEQ